MKQSNTGQRGNFPRTSCVWQQPNLGFLNCFPCRSDLSAVRKASLESVDGFGLGIAISHL